MRNTMATTKSKATAPKAPAKRAAKAPPAKAARTRSLLVEEGDRAMRKLLLSTLNRLDWVLTAAASELRMTGPSNVLHSIRRLGLSKELDAARAAGKVSPGNRTA